MRLNRLSLRKKLALSAVVAGAFTALSPQTHATNFWWDGVGALVDGASQGGTGTWDTTTTNWDDGSALVAWPGAGTDNDAIFGGTAGLVTLGAPINVNDLTFLTAGYEIAGTGLNILTLNGATTNTITNGTGINAKISAVIAGTTGLAKAGDGRLTLTGANTVTGVVSLSAGTLRAETNAAALGAGTLTLGIGTTLELANDTGLTFGRNTTLAAGAGTFTITSDRLTPGAGVTHVLGTLATGTGGQTLAINAGSNSTSGQAGVSLGAVTLNSATTFSVGNGALLTLTGVPAGGANAVTYDLTGDMSVTASMTGTGTQIKNGPGTLTFTADPNQTGAMTINNGIVVLNHSGTIDFATTINTGGTLRATTAGLSGTNDVAVNGGTLDVRVTQTLRTLTGTTAGIVTNGGAAAAVLTIGNGNPVAMTYNGVIQSGAGAATLGLTLASSNGATLTNTNPYTGPTAINAGTLTINSPTGALTGTSITIGDNNGGNEALTVGAVGDIVPVTLNRLGNTATITLNSGTGTGFTYNGPATGSLDNVETIGSLVFNNNRNIVTLVPGTGNDVQLTTGTLTRSNNGTGLIRGTNLGGTGAGSTRLFVTTPALTGSGGADGTTSKSILNFVVGDTSATGAGTGFLTDSANGLRLLTASEYDAAIAGGSFTLRNVSATGGETVTASARINSLLVPSGTTTINSPASVLVNSGAVQFTGNATLAGTGMLSLPATGGTIGVALNTTAATGTINSVVGGLGTIVLSSTGDVTNNLLLGGNNIFNGSWQVNSGALIVGNAGALNSKIPNAVTLTPGNGGLQLNGNSIAVRDLNTIAGGSAISNTSNTTATLTNHLTAARTINAVIANGTGTGLLNLAVNGSTGGNTLTVTADASTTGTFLGRNGAVTLNGANGTLNDMTGFNLQGFTLRLTNTNTANNTNRILNGGTILMNRGTIDFDNNSGAANFSETVGTITLGGSVNIITVDRGGTANTSTFTAASLTRNVGATLLLSSQINGTATASTLGIDTRSRLVFTTAPTLNDGIIGGWALAETTAGREFAKYVSSGTISATNLVTADYNVGGATLVAAAATTNLLLTAGETLPAATPKTINSLTVNQTVASTIDLGGNTLTVDTGGIAVNGAFNTSITNGTLTAGTSNELFAHNNTANPLTISAVIADNGNPVSFYRWGATGTTILSAANTYTGKTFVNGGTLSISADNNLGTAPASPVDGSIVISSSATLALTETMTLNSNRGILIGSNTPGSVNTISLVSGATAGAAKTLTFNGKLESINEGGLAILNNANGTNTFGGSVVLSPSNVLDFSGSLRVDQGAVTLAAGNNVIGRSLQIGSNNTATSSFTQSSGTLTVGSGVDDVLEIAHNLVTTITPNSVLKGTTNFNLAGTSNFTANVDQVRIQVLTGDNLVGASATFATNNDITARTQVLISHAAGLADISGSTTTVTLGSGINNITTPLLTWGGTKGTPILSLPANGVINLNGGGTRLMDFYVGRQNVSTGSLSLPAFNASTGILNASLNNLIIGDKNTGGIGGVDSSLSIGSNAANLVETNSITLGTMAGASGTTTAISRAFGTLNIAGGQLVNFGDLNLGVYAGTLGTARGNFNLTGGSVIIAGNITKSDNTRSAAMILVDGATTSLSLQHTAAGDTTAGTITASQLDYRNGTISNVSSATFDGRSVTNGITFGNLAEALIVRDVTANFPINLTNATANQGGIRYSNANAGAGSTLGGTLNLGTVNRTINVDDSAAAANDLTITGVISGTGAVGITKSGLGTLNLTGNNNYGGTTIVTAGTLRVNGTHSGTGAVTVNATGTLGGSGSLAGATTVDGSVAPGNSIGTLTVNNDVTWNGGTSWVWELGAGGGTLAAPGSSDLLNLTGNFIKGSGSSWAFDFSNTGAVGVYKLVDWNGALTTSFVGTDFSASNLASGLTSSFTVDNTNKALFLTLASAGGATGTTYTLAAAPTTLNILQGGNLSGSVTVQNTGTGTADTLTFTNLTGSSGTPSVATATGTLAGGTLAQGASSVQSLTVNGIANGSATITSQVASATNTTLATTATLSPPAGTINVVVGNASYAGGNSSAAPGQALSSLTPISVTAYTNLASNTVGLTSTGTTVPAIGTTATLLYYKNSTGSDTGVSMAWRSRKTVEASSAVPGDNGSTAVGYLISDVVTLTGMVNTTGINSTDPLRQTDIFVLQMSYDQNKLGVDIASAANHEAAGGALGRIYLAWNDTLNGGWTNAVNGNIGGTNEFVFRGYLPGDELVLGRWGVDISNNVAWAVLNHNSEFAVIPEPSTLVLGGLALLGLAGMGLRRRRLAKQGA